MSVASLYWATEAASLSPSISITCTAFAPAATHRATMAAPIPLAPPVTTIRLFLSIRSTSWSQRQCEQDQAYATTAAPIVTPKIEKGPRPCSGTCDLSSDLVLKLTNSIRVSIKSDELSQARACSHCSRRPNPIVLRQWQTLSCLLNRIIDQLGIHFMPMSQLQLVVVSKPKMLSSRRFHSFVDVRQIS